MVSLFAVVLSAATVLRYWSFQTYAWDLGIYNQAMHTTLFGGRFFYYTADLPAGTQGSLFAVHFSPFLFLLLPFYAAVPSPATLLVAQAVGVALAAVPLYGIVKDRLGSARWGLAVAAAYLVSPVTQGLAWYDFHPEAFLPVTVLAAFYFLGRRRPLPFLLCWLLALAVVEEIAPFLALFALLSLLPSLPFFRRVMVVRIGSAAFPQKWYLLAFLAASAWIAVAYEVLVHAGAIGGGAFGASYGVNWEILGAASPLGVYPQAILHPSLALAALSYQAPEKLVYLALLFGTVAFLPWVSEDRALFPVLAWVGLAVLSNNSAYYTLGDQYSAYALPFLYLGLVDGLVHVRPWWARLLRWARTLRPPLPTRAEGVPARRRRAWRGALSGERPIGLAVVGLAVVGALVASPLLPAPAGSFNEITYGVPSVSAHDLLLHRVIDLLPPSASVLTTTTLFPEVSSGTHAFVLPTSSYFVGDSTFGQAVGHYVNESRFLLMDYRLDPYSSAILAASVNFTGFGLYAEANGAYLYQRGWTAPPVLYVPWSSVEVSPSSLLLGNAVLDSNVPGMPLHHAPGTANGTEIWSGVGLYPVPPGTYHVTLDLRVVGEAGEPSLLLDLLRTPISVGLDLVNPSPTGHDYGFVLSADASKSQVASLSPVAPAGGGGWENVTLTGSWPFMGTLDCQGWALAPNADIWLYGITVQQTSAVPSGGALE